MESYQSIDAELINVCSMLEKIEEKTQDAIMQKLKPEENLLF